MSGRFSKARPSKRKKVNTPGSPALQHSKSNGPETMEFPPVTFNNMKSPPVSFNAMESSPVSVNTMGLPPDSINTIKSSHAYVNTMGIPPDSINTIKSSHASVSTSGLPPDSINTIKPCHPSVNNMGLSSTSINTMMPPPTSVNTIDSSSASVNTMEPPPTAVITIDSPLDNINTMEPLSTSVNTIESPHGSNNDSHTPSKSNRPKFYMTKQRKRMNKTGQKQLKTMKFNAALKDCERGTFKSVRECAAHHQVPYSTLHRLFTDINAVGYVGSGQAKGCLNVEEEKQVINHVKWRASVGCGVNWEQLQLLIQEVLLAIKAANPSRITRYESSNQLPNRHFVRRFAERHNLSLRSSAEISKGK